MGTADIVSGVFRGCVESQRRVVTKHILNALLVMFRGQIEWW